MLVPAVKSGDVSFFEVIDFVIPCGAKNSVQIPGRRQNGGNGEAEHNIAIKPFPAQQNTALVFRLAANQPAVFQLPTSALGFEICLPVFVRLVGKQYLGLLRYNPLSQQKNILVHCKSLLFSILTKALFLQKNKFSFFFVIFSAYKNY